MKLLVYLLPPATKLGQGYIFTGICDSVHSGGFASVHAGMPPLGPGPPGPGTPGTRHPPRTRHHPSRDQAPPPPEQSILGDMHPTGMQSCYNFANT